MRIEHVDYYLNIRIDYAYIFFFRDTKPDNSKLTISEPLNLDDYPSYLKSVQLIKFL